MSYRVCIEETFRRVNRQRWDTLMSRCGAPVFYLSDFLQAFECWPLHTVERTFYVSGVRDDGQLEFAFPLFLQRGVDPMRVVSTYFPAHSSDLVLLSHVWHCYDTWLPARTLTAPLLHDILAVVRELAMTLGASLFGFVNVEATGTLAQALTAAGMDGIDIDRRFVADLSVFGTLDDYLDGLKSKERSNFRRYLCRAQDAGVTTVIGSPSELDLDGFVDLARAGAEKYQNADYYQPGIFQNFVRALGGRARLMETRWEERLIGSTILLQDQQRIHFWACGVDYTAIPQVSPFYLAFIAALEEAITTRVPIFEMGRRNETFKLRNGLLPRVVQAYVMPTVQECMVSPEARRVGMRME
ncbi:MAG TPA: GNAT family N-acetyltransferase [Ktedonobacteraceae bacterium]|nr:GNAT family N-acetyltransferase [Ktedonobacteraceae bacterium]